MLTVLCDICGSRILNVNGGICSHCYYRDEVAQCSVCGVEMKANEYFLQNRRCYACYYLNENCECKGCGREITFFDWVDYNGECAYCHDDCVES